MANDNIREVTPKKAKEAIKHCIRARRPLFLWGPPGIGKSDIVKQIGDDLKREVIDIRLPLWDPTDIKGVPYFDSVEKVMRWAPPVELPKDGNAILFLDEMNAAPPAVQAAAYQLILNRRVGTYYLPDGVDIIAAGNRESDRGVVYKMPSPLANRFMHLAMKHSFDDFLEWGVKNRLHNEVLGYLSYSKGDLFDFDPAKMNGPAFPTPRSWSFVSQILQNTDYVSEDIISDLVGGTIGMGLGAKFMAHRKVVHKLPAAKDILNGKVTKLDKLDKDYDISVKYSLIINLCYELKESADRKDKNHNEYIDSFMRFSMDNFEAELVAAGIKIAISEYGLKFESKKMKNFDEFHERYGKYFIAALKHAS